MAIRRKRRSAKLNRIVVLLVAAVVLFCAGNSYLDKQGQELPLDLPSFSGWLDWLDGWEPGSIGGTGGSALPVSTGAQELPLRVHYLDMGQADSILIQAPKKTVLIDAGENNQGEQVLAYLKELGVSKLDYVVGTHPHSDHIGGMDTVIDSISVGEIILPDLPEEVVPTTITYTDLLYSIARQQVKIILADPGRRYDLGGGASLAILGPTAQFSNLNNSSVVTRLEYGEVSFLFTGDGEKEAEMGLLESGQSLSSTVMDAGHHGSSTSNTQDFLEAVSPQIVVISCGLDNSYGHPHREVMERLEARSVQVLRTDLSGTVVIGTDGSSLQIQTER